MTFKLVVEKNYKLFSTIYRHPFKREVEDCSLPLDKFITYIIQDRYYLTQLARTFDIMSEKCKKNGYQYHDFFNHVKSEMLRTSDLQKKYPKLFPQNRFFKSAPFRITPVISDYINHLDYQTATLPISIALPRFVSAVTPCFYIYQQLGEQMAALPHHSDNPFQTWINGNRGSEFVKSTFELIRIWEELYINQNNAESDEMEKIVQKSAKFELDFFDVSYYGEQAYQSMSLQKETICSNRAA